jgi:hypothetical protein
MSLAAIASDMVALDSPDPLAVRQNIADLEAAMFQAPQLEIETRHYFSDGVYAREIVIPEGALITGKIHAFEHINVVSKGSISVLTENGARRIDAPCTFIAPPGTKRVGLAHAETVWTTLHAVPNHIRTPDEAEALLILPTHPDALTVTAADVELLTEGAGA